MFVGITNEPRDYAWGSATAIAELLGRAPSGGPEAELWFGAHPGSPSRIIDPASAAGATTLLQFIEDEPAVALGPRRESLPFLLKLLAADAPLSLQAHPNTEQAKAGFAREEEDGVAADAPTRNYHDPNAKPELVLALSETFEALAGFRHVSETRLLLAELATAATGAHRAAIDDFEALLGAGTNPALAGATGSSADVHRDGDPGTDTVPDDADGDVNPLHAAVSWLLSGDPGVAPLVDAVTATVDAAPTGSSFAREWATAADLAVHYPGDPGIVLSLLLNRVSLAQGQALYLPAGNMHAYLKGLGVELMGASDNVLRGGLTTKHVDVDELLSIVDFHSLPVPIVRPDSPAPGIVCFRPDTDEFVLAQVTLGEAGYEHGYQTAGPDSASFTLTGPAIALAVEGSVEIRGAKSQSALGRGDAVYITPDEGDLVFTGSGSVFVATTP